MSEAEVRKSGSNLKMLVYVCQHKVSPHMMYGLMKGSDYHLCNWIPPRNKVDEESSKAAELGSTALQGTVLPRQQGMDSR